MRTPRLTAEWSLGPAVGTYAPASRGGPAARASVLPMQGACAGVNSSTLGSCFDANGPVPGRFNCAACCALRNAVAWVDVNTNPPTVVNC